MNRFESWYHLLHATCAMTLPLPFLVPGSSTAQPELAGTVGELGASLVLVAGTMDTLVTVSKVVVCGVGSVLSNDVDEDSSTYSASGQETSEKNSMEEGSSIFAEDISSDQQLQTRPSM
jgi:hypothetical protein